MSTEKTEREILPIETLPQAISALNAISRTFKGLAAVLLTSDTFRHEAIDELRMCWEGENWDQKIVFTTDILSMFTIDQLKAYGFQEFDEGFVLVPVWFWHYMADGCELLTINDKLHVKGVDAASMGHRDFMTAYGFLHNADEHRKRIAVIKHCGVVEGDLIQRLKHSEQIINGNG